VRIHLIRVPRMQQQGRLKPQGVPRHRVHAVERHLELGTVNFTGPISGKDKVASKTGRERGYAKTSCARRMQAKQRCMLACLELVSEVCSRAAPVHLSEVLCLQRRRHTRTHTRTHAHTHTHQLQPQQQQQRAHKPNKPACKHRVRVYTSTVMQGMGIQRYEPLSRVGDGCPGRVACERTHQNPRTRIRWRQTPRTPTTAPMQQ
jgi:hypothetical protein